MLEYMYKLIKGTNMLPTSLRHKAIPSYKSSQAISRTLARMSSATSTTAGQDAGNTQDPNQPPKFDIPVTEMSSKQIERKLIKARIAMLLVAPFFGNLATRLMMCDATDWPGGPIQTAGTDGKYFYYNRNFVAAISDQETIFLWGHEVLHCVYDHMDRDRMGDRIPELWNIANDYVINWELVEAGIGTRITLIDICFDRKFKDMPSENVYDILYDDARKKGSNGTGGQVLMDTHMPRGDGDDAEAGKGANGGEMPGTGPARYTEEEKDAIATNFRSAVIQAVQAVGAGNLPGGVKRMLDHLLNPQIDWRELLAAEIKSIIKNDYNFMRFSKKGLDQGIFLPGMDNDETIDVCIGIDTSGSISKDMLRDFLSEVKGIMDSYPEFSLQLWCFDTEIHNPQSFTADTADELLDYEMDGFGGTDFMPNWEFMKSEGIDPKKFIMFTDGYPYGSWGDKHYCETLFIVHGEKNATSPKAPFGITVPYQHANHVRQESSAVGG